MADFEWLRRRLVEEYDGGLNLTCCSSIGPPLTRLPVSPLPATGVIVPPLPERTVTEAAAEAALVAAGSASSALVGAALAAATPAGQAVVSRMQRASLLERFLARCAVHPLLRVSPTLALFLQTREDAQWAALAPWRERDGVTISDALSSVASSLFASATRGEGGPGASTVSSAVADTLAFGAGAATGMGLITAMATSMSAAGGASNGGGDGHLAEGSDGSSRLLLTDSRRDGGVASYISRLEVGLTGFIDALRALNDAQAACAEPIVQLSARTAAAAKGEPRGGRAIHGGGHSATPLPSPPWHACGECCDKMVAPADGLSWAMHESVLPPLHDALALVRAAQGALAHRTQLVRSHGAACQQLSAKEEALRAARDEATSGSATQLPILAEELRQLRLVRDELAARHGVFVDRFEGKEVPHFRRELASLMRGALRALAWAQAAAANGVAKAATPFGGQSGLRLSTASTGGGSPMGSEAGHSLFGGGNSGRLHVSTTPNGGVGSPTGLGSPPDTPGTLARVGSAPELRLDRHPGALFQGARGLAGQSPSLPATPYRRNSLGEASSMSDGAGRPPVTGSGARVSPVPGILSAPLSPHRRAQLEASRVNATPESMAAAAIAAATAAAVVSSAANAAATEFFDAANRRADSPPPQEERQGGVYLGTPSHVPPRSPGGAGTLTHSGSAKQLGRSGSLGYMARGAMFVDDEARAAFASSSSSRPPLSRVATATPPAVTPSSAAAAAASGNMSRGIASAVEDVVAFGLDPSTQKGRRSLFTEPLVAAKKKLPG